MWKSFASTGAQLETWFHIAWTIVVTMRSIWKWLLWRSVITPRKWQRVTAIIMNKTSLLMWNFENDFLLIANCHKSVATIHIGYTVMTYKLCLLNISVLTFIINNFIVNRYTFHIWCRITWSIVVYIAGHSELRCNSGLLYYITSSECGVLYCTSNLWNLSETRSFQLNSSGWSLLYASIGILVSWLHADVDTVHKHKSLRRNIIRYSQKPKKQYSWMNGTCRQGHAT